MQGNDRFELVIIAPEAVLEHYNYFHHATTQSNLSSAELIDAYHAADCLLMTVKDATANNAILEAMACGLPIVCEDNPSIRFYANQQSTVYFPNDDVDSLVSTVENLSSSREKLVYMSKAARLNAMEFDWLKIVKMQQDVYRGVLKKQ